MTDKSSNSIGFLVDFAAGGVSGAVSKTITAPIEKVKLAIQNQDSNPKILLGEMQRYSGIGNCFMRHVKELGPASLWRGNVANCTRYVPTAAFNLAFKDSFKNIFPKYDKKTESAKFTAANFASGALAGAVTNTLVYPLVYVRTVLGADIGKVRKYTGVGDCLVKTFRMNGFFSLYNGVLASTVGIVVYRGTQFGIQDTLKAFNPYQKDLSIIGMTSKFCAAQVSVAISGITAYPFDTVQRRLQLEATKPTDQRLYNGLADCVTKIYAVEGIRGFFKGAVANILRGTGAALVLVLYDEIKYAIYKMQ